MSLRVCMDFIHVIDTVRNRRPLALHGSVSAFFAHRVRKLLHITQNPKQSLNSTYTSTPIPYPHKPHHHTTKNSRRNSKGATRPTLEVKTPRVVDWVKLYGLIENRVKTPVLSAWGEPPKGGKSSQT